MTLLKKLGNYILSKNFVLNVLAIGIVYVLGYYLINYKLDAQTNFGQKLEVPNLIGKNQNNLENIFGALDLEYEVLDSIYAPDKIEGTILEQDPMPTDSTNIYVKSGRIVKVRVSKRTQLVEVPTLVDKSQRFAEIMLANGGFRYSLEYKPSKEAHGAVISQLYKGKPVVEGMKIPIGSKIKLIIGRDEAGEPLPLPNLYGLSIVEAKERVRNIGNLELYVQCPDCLTREDTLVATVHTQSPEYSEESIVASGSTITVIASKRASETPQ